MSTFDNEYYVVETYYNSTQFFISPDESTADRNYRFERLTGYVPLRFHNGFKERDARTGDKRKVSDIMLDGSSFVVTDEIKKFLEQFEINGLQLYPAIVIDDQDTWHEHYWYLNFFESLDCWDRNLSEYEYIDEDDPDCLADVDHYVLDETVLSAIPEEQRLIFKMGGVSLPYVFVHKSIAKYLLENAYTGIRLFKVADFTEGDQH